MNHTNISCKMFPSKYNSGILLWHMGIALNIQYTVNILFVLFPQQDFAILCIFTSYKSQWINTERDGSNTSILAVYKYSGKKAHNNALFSMTIFKIS